MGNESASDKSRMRAFEHCFARLLCESSNQGNKFTRTKLFRCSVSIYLAKTLQNIIRVYTSLTIQSSGVCDRTDGPTRSSKLKTRPRTARAHITLSAKDLIHSFSASHLNDQPLVIPLAKTTRSPWLDFFRHTRRT